MHASSSPVPKQPQAVRSWDNEVETCAMLRDDWAETFRRQTRKSSCDHLKHPHADWSGCPLFLSGRRCRRTQSHGPWLFNSFLFGYIDHVSGSLFCFDNYVIIIMRDLHCIMSVILSLALPACLTSRSHHRSLGGQAVGLFVTTCLHANTNEQKLNLTITF